MYTFAPAALLSVVTLTLLAAPSHGAAADGLLADTTWESFADSVAPASFAWAGEDETFGAQTDVLGRAGLVTVDDRDLDVRSLTGLPAPEPPALVLAGMAFGGVLFGRSLLGRRKRSAGSEAETP